VLMSGFSQIESELFVELERCVLVVQKASLADGSVLGKLGEVDATAEFAGHVQQRLGLQVLSSSIEGGCENPVLSAAHKLQSQEILAVRFGARGFHRMVLLVSPQVKDSILQFRCDFQILADDRLRGADQCLLIPAISRRSSLQVRSTVVKLSDFVNADDFGDDSAGVRKATAISEFFFGHVRFYEVCLSLDSCNLMSFHMNEKSLPSSGILISSTASLDFGYVPSDVAHFCDLSSISFFCHGVDILFPWRVAFSCVILMLSERYSCRQ